MLPDYILGTNISGYRKVTLEVKGSDVETDSESITLSEDEGDTNETSDEQEAEPTVSEEDFNNYKKSAEIIKARLKSLKVDDFTLALEGSTGKIELTLPENDQTDVILSDLTQVGKFEISDTHTGDVLLTNDDIRDVAVEKTESYGYSVVQMNIKFTIAGSRKFKDITRDYNENAVVETENTVTESDNAVENLTSEVTEETEPVNETTEGDSTSTETTAKTVTLKIDDTEMLSTGFSDIIENGILSLTLGSSTDDEEIKETMYSGNNVASILENDPLPIEYEVSENVYVASTVNTNKIIIVLGVMIAIALIISIFLIVKFKMNGLLATFLSVGYIALLLIVIRYTNVTVSLEGIFAVGLAFIINSLFNYILFSKLKDETLNQEECIDQYNDSIKKYSLILIPLLILSVACCFTNWDTIYSFGMILFWTIVISLLYNLTVTNILVRNK